MKSKAWNHFDEGRALYRLSRSLSVAEMAYCLAILVHGNRKTGDTYVGPDKIAADTGYKVRAIKGAAAEMKRRGVVSVVEAGKRGHRGVVRLTASQLSAAPCTEYDGDSVHGHAPNQPVDSVQSCAPNDGDSVHGGARFGARRGMNAVHGGAPSTTYLTTQSTLRVHAHTPRTAKRKQPTGAHHDTVRAFCDAWKTRYGAAYRFPKAKGGAMVKRLLVDAGGAPEAKQIIDAYFADEDPWLKQQAHPLGVLVSKVNTYRARLAGGSDGEIDFEHAPGPFKICDPTPEQAAKFEEALRAGTV